MESFDFTPWMRVVTPDGDELVEGEDSGNTAELTAELPADGEYTVYAQSYYPDAFGRYELTVELLSGSERTDKEDPITTTPAPDTPAEETPAPADPETPDEEPTPVTTVPPDTPADDTERGRDVRSLSYGESTEGELTPADPDAPEEDGTGIRADAYRFTDAEGDNVEITMSSHDFNPWLRVITTDGDEVAEGNSSPDTTTLTMELPKDGQYIAYAQSYSDDAYGQYDIGIELLDGAPDDTVSSATGTESDPTPEEGTEAGFDDTPAASATSIDIGDTVNGRLSATDADHRSDRGYFDLYVFEGSVGQQIDIAMRSSTGDSYLQLNAPDGRTVAWNDDGLGGFDAAISGYELQQDGRYEIVATTPSEGSTFGYELTLQAGKADIYPFDLLEFSGDEASAITQASSDEVSLTIDGEGELGGVRGIPGFVDWDDDGNLVGQNNGNLTVWPEAGAGSSPISLDGIDEFAMPSFRNGDIIFQQSGLLKRVTNTSEILDPNSAISTADIELVGPALGLGLGPSNRYRNVDLPGGDGDFDLPESDDLGDGENRGEDYHIATIPAGGYELELRVGRDDFDLDRISREQNLPHANIEVFKVDGVDDKQSVFNLHVLLYRSAFTTPCVHFFESKSGYERGEYCLDLDRLFRQWGEILSSVIAQSSSALRNAQVARNMFQLGQVIAYYTAIMTTVTISIFAAP